MPGPFITRRHTRAAGDVGGVEADGVADPATLDCLFKATELKFDYLDYDDTYQFARKCIKAIATIGTGNAIEKLKLLALSPTPEIAEYAKKELRYKELM